MISACASVDFFVDRDRPAPAAGPQVTLAGLIPQMADLGTLAEYPEPSFVNAQASSYDRKSISPDKDWFANDDRGQYIRVEEVEGRKEYVMMDAKGPGAITRIWSANPEGVLRFYLNGETQPRFIVDMKELLGGKHPYFPAPYITGERSRGFNIYFPIPYSRSMKLTSDRGAFYYQVNYRTYPADTRVEDFTIERVGELKPQIDALISRLKAEERPIVSLAGAAHTTVHNGGETTILNTRRGGFAVDELRIHLKSGNDMAALRGVLLLGYFDGATKPQILSPVGDFFGSAPGINHYESLPLGHLEDGTMYSRWRMPFAKSARLVMINRSGAAVEIASNVKLNPLARGWTNRMMHFHAGYKFGLQMTTRPFTDYNFVEVTGKGVFVGDALHVVNPVKGWWGEGDEKIYVDGETFPSHFGTGTEDYYGYAWCSPEQFYHPYHNQPRCDGPQNFGHTSVNRWHILDSIPFERSFKFDMEVWHWAEKVVVDYHTVSYWYAMPGSTNNITPPAGDGLRVAVVNPPVKFKVAGAIEAEGLERSVMGGRAEDQDLSSFGENKWSMDTHVWFTKGKPGDSIEFKFDAPAAGSYEVIAQFTKAHDYGIAEVSLNGVVAIPALDLYDKGVVPSGEISLGVHTLKAAGNALTMKVTGIIEQSKPKLYMMGLDYVKLTKK